MTRHAGPSWVLACVLAETVGMGAAAGAARAADTVGVLAGFLLVLAGGLCEGTVLGLLQGRVMHARFRARRLAWAAATVLVAGVGWAAASAPATLAGGEDSGSAPPLWLVLPGTALLGLTMGALLGAAQAVVLRHRVRHPWRWVGASACGWTAAMPVIFLGAMTAGAGWPVAVVVGYGALTGAAAGAALGVVTGVWLHSLDGLPLRHRAVLHHLVHSGRPARTGWSALTVTGRRSGRRFSFPVMTAPLGHRSFVVLPGHAERKTWWRNLGPGSLVALLDTGAWMPARARLLRPGSLEFSVARSAYLARWPRTRVGAGPLVVLDLGQARDEADATGDQGPVAVGPDAVGAASSGS